MHQQMSSPATVIQTRGLVKRYDDYLAVDDVSVRVERGQIYGFLGPNGAGKTTTIQMILGLIRPNQGSINVFGHDLTDNRRQILARVGSLIESPSFYANLTGYENLQVTQRMLGLSTSQIDRVLETVNLTYAADKRAGDYSMGMKQRLALAQALIHEPDLLILDEPTSGMDPAGIREMRDWMTSLPEQAGVTIFMSSHILSEVQAIATHVGIIRKGQLVFEGAMSDLRQYARPTVHIRTSDDTRARALLIDDFPQIRETDDGLIVQAPADATGMINQRLMTAGVTVNELSQRERTLEDVFFLMTESDTPARQTAVTGDK